MCRVIIIYYFFLIYYERKKGVVKMATPEKAQIS